MKIALDGKRFFNNNSGLGNYSRDLVRMVASAFPNVDFFLFNARKSERGKEILQLNNVHFQATSPGKLARQLKMGIDAQNAGADIFHGLSGELPLKWNQKKIVKIVTIHDLIFLRFPQYYSYFDRKIHLWKFRKAAKIADVIVAISEQTKSDIVQYLKVKPEKIQVIYQGCHQSFQEEIHQDFYALVQEKYNLPEKFLLNVGTIEDRKNLLNILRALQGTEIPLVVVGKKTKYFSKVEKYLKNNGMRQQVFFLENVTMPELAAIYRLATIFIYPSFFEGFGIPVIEALFSKTPVISSNTSSLPEAGGPDALYINPENWADMHAKILFLWNNEAERKRRSDRGFDYAQRFKDEKIAAEMMALYHKAIQQFS